MSAGTLIVYHSRTGHTKELADDLAAHLSAVVEPALAPRNRREGDWPLPRLLVAALLHIPLESAAPRNRPSDFPLVVVASPVWMGRAMPPVRGFLARHGRAIDRLAFVLSAGRCGADFAFRDMADLAGKPPLASLCIDDADRLLGRREAKIQTFAEDLERRTAAAGRPPDVRNRPMVAPAARSAEIHLLRPFR